MPRIVSWFSCGAASAVATKIALIDGPVTIAYCDTGSEHEDNKRFMADCEVWFGQSVTVLKNDKYADTWDVWEKRKYLGGIAGAPCTGILKVEPRLDFQRPDDVHVYGFTNDAADINRAKRIRENNFDMTIRTPLIERGLDKAACLAMIQGAGIKEPVTYSMGFPNANCLPCVKATSPDYWSLYRLRFPEGFARMVELSRRLGARLTRINDERIFIDEIPDDWPVTQAIAPACDLLCGAVQQEISDK
jgi:3'-phosphoadenosine 5'-phosphosulfate sulfotransferase (PAPS reductase)/FAD synthetase